MRLLNKTSEMQGSRDFFGTMFLLISNGRSDPPPKKRLFLREKEGNGIENGITGL